MEYNGWTNWETWNFKLWLDNDEITYKIANKIAETSSDVYDTSLALEQWAGRASERISKDADSLDSLAGFFTDMINSSIKEVNFFEIAEHLHEEWS